MEQKFQAWFKQLDELPPKDKEAELTIMKLEKHNIELRMFVYELIKEIKEKDKIISDLKEVLQ